MNEYGKNTEKTISGKPTKWKGIVIIVLSNQRKETTYDQKWKKPRGTLNNFTTSWAE